MLEKIVESKICKQCLCNFSITDRDLEFYKKVSPKFNGEILKIPRPTLCSDCRRKRRLSFRNERNLYKRKCDISGEDIISIYSPDKKYTVYDQNIWWSDSWSSTSYGKKYNNEKNIFAQFQELLGEVPHLSLYQLNCENSDFINACSSCSDSYMSFNSDFSENLLYSYAGRNCKDCVDTSYCDKCENSYELLECGKCISVFYSIKTSRCSFSSFLYSCKNCEYCFLSSNLENKKYCILNKQYSENQYNEQKEELLKKGFACLEEKFQLLMSDSVRREKTGYSNEGSTGDNIFFTKDCENCYDSNNLQSCTNCNYLVHSKDCMDYEIFGDNSSLVYECIAVGKNISRVLFSLYCFESSDLLYCYGVSTSKHCFACVNIRNKQYCIFNKQYTKERYNTLVPEIIKKMQQYGEWGEFFLPSLSPFGYNETVAQECFPLEKEELLHLGFNWSNYSSPSLDVKKIIPANKLPQNISDVPDDILNWAIECEITQKLFRIIPQELEFYRKHNLPIPRRHPDKRHLDRMNLRNSRKLFVRNCDKCGMKMKTTYSLDRLEIVYCDICYNKELY